MLDVVAGEAALPRVQGPAPLPWPREAEVIGRGDVDGERALFGLAPRS